MSQFEFLFSLYGLLLGLGIAELAGGFSRLYDRRKTQPIGWLGPGLAALLISDLLTFWLAAWSFRDWPVKYLLTLAAAAVGLSYYFATTQVFPRHGAIESADAHAMAHRRVVTGILFAINLFVFGAAWSGPLMRAGFTERFMQVVVVDLCYFALLAWVFFARSVRQAALAAWSAVAFEVIVVGILA